MSYEDDDIEGGGFTGYHVYSGALRKHGVDRESATSMWNGLAPSTKRAFGAHAKSLYEKYEGAAGEHISVASMSKALKDSIMKAINKIKNVTEAELLAAEADAADAALFDDDEDDLDADDDAALAEAAEASIVGGAGKKAAWAHGMDDLGAFGSAVVTEKIAARAAAAAAAAAAAKKKKPEVTAAHLEAFLDRMPSGLKKFFIKDRRLAALAIFTRTLAEDKDIPVSVELLENAAAAAIFGGTLSEEAKKEVREAVIKDASKFLDWKKSIYMREALQTDTQSIDKAIQSKPKFRFQGFGTGPDKEIVYLGGGGRRPAPAIGGGGWYKYY